MKKLLTLALVFICGCSQRKVLPIPIIITHGVVKDSLVLTPSAKCIWAMDSALVNKAIGIGIDSVSIDRSQIIPWRSNETPHFDGYSSDTTYLVSRNGTVDTVHFKN